MEQPPPPESAEDAAALQRALVDFLVGEGHITGAAVEAAFHAVPRHLFLPGLPLDQVYRDAAVITRRIDGLPVSSSSQPAIMAIMLEQLDLRPGQRVLEIGAGTGYNAALMAHVVGPAGRVATMDIDEEIVAEARAHLAGIANVEVVCGDGGLGYPAAAPYDRIILTVGAWDILPAWTEQLRPDGRLVLPLALGGVQQSVAFERAGDHLASVSVRDCGFMRLRGAFTGPERALPLGPDPGLRLLTEAPNQIDPDEAYGWLTGPSRDHAAGLQVTPREVFRGLVPWLGLHEPGLCTVISTGEQTARALVPCVGEGSAAGVATQTGLCLLTRPPGEMPPEPREPEDGQGGPPFDLHLREYGSNAALAQRVLDHITAWDRAGRPPSESRSIRAYPVERSYTPATGETVIVKHRTQLVVSYWT